MFVSAEKNGISELAARTLLEEALTQQFKKLVMGMYSYAYLKDKKYFNMQALYDMNSNYFSGDDKYDDFKRKFSIGIIKKEWPVISTRELCDIEIRVFNKYVKLSRAFEINEQLSRLYSAHRVFIAAIEDIAMTQIESVIGKDSKRDIDGRLIYGKISNLSATYFGALYDF
jgi:hypothetical protein